MVATENKCIGPLELPMTQTDMRTDLADFDVHGPTQMD
jgi:hypothetical protein